MHFHSYRPSHYLNIWSCEKYWKFHISLKLIWVMNSFGCSFGVKIKFNEKKWKSLNLWRIWNAIFISRMNHTHFISIWFHSNQFFFERMNRLPLIFLLNIFHNFQCSANILASIIITFKSCTVHTVFKAHNENKTDYENANVLANGKQQPLP